MDSYGQYQPKQRNYPYEDDSMSGQFVGQGAYPQFYPTNYPQGSTEPNLEAARLAHLRAQGLLHPGLFDNLSQMVLQAIMHAQQHK